MDLAAGPPPQGSHSVDSTGIVKHLERVGKPMVLDLVPTLGMITQKYQLALSESSVIHSIVVALIPPSCLVSSPLSDMFLGHMYALLVFSDPLLQAVMLMRCTVGAEEEVYGQPGVLAKHQKVW